MFHNNPFSLIAEFTPPLLLQVYVVLMIFAVIVGTLFDVWHKGSARFFARRRQLSRAAAQRELSSGETVSLALETIAEAAVSGEFSKWPRRISHLLMMYGFFAYIIATVAMVFCYPDNATTPLVWPALWIIGSLMILAGGSWFFFFLRVNVAYDGDSPFHLGRADLFIGSLLASVALGLIWHFVQTTSENETAIAVLFTMYIFFTTMLFVTVPSSKFAHMFFKPAVAFQRRIEEANGSSDLPSPSAENHIVRS